MVNWRLLTLLYSLFTSDLSLLLSTPMCFSLISQELNTNKNLKVHSLLSCLLLRHDVLYHNSAPVFSFGSSTSFEPNLAIPCTVLRFTQQSSLRANRWTPPTEAKLEDTLQPLKDTRLDWAETSRNANDMGIKPSVSKDSSYRSAPIAVHYCPHRLTTLSKLIQH